MRFLVTGGAGFIGSAVCRAIVADTDHSVVNVDKLTYAANLDSLASIAGSSRYAFYRADICERAAIERILRAEDPDVILHLAAESHVDRSISGPAAFIATNVVGTAALLEAARAHRDRLEPGRRDAFRFVQVSTDEVYGSLGPTGRFAEASPYDPSSPYAASKAAGDHLARAWWRTYGLATIITNSSNNYGPFQFPEKLIPLIITNALIGRPLPVYGAGANVRDWLHVEDHAGALVEIATRGAPGETYNVGARAERTNLQVVEAICDHLDVVAPTEDRASHRDLITFVEDRPGHDLRYAIDPSKLEAVLGWRPRMPFEAGLERTVEWYVANADWWRPLREAVYDGERLGLAE